MSEATKGGYVVLSDVRVPDDVRPGDSFRAEADVKNGADFINPWDPDICHTTHAGYQLEIVFEGPGGQSVVKGPTCLTTAAVGKREETYTATFAAPSGGRADVEAYVRLPGSGKRTHTMDASADVSADAPTEPDDPGSDDGGDGGSGPDLEGSAKWVALGLVAFAVAWGADSAEGIVS